MKVSKLSRYSYQKLLTIILLIAGFAEAVYLRKYFIIRESPDYIAYVERWYDYILKAGFIDAFRDYFADYPPLYLHLIALLTLITSESLYAIKILSYAFEILAAFFIYKIVYHHSNNKIYSLKAGLLFLLIPTVILNSAWWGQCDVIYSSMIIASIYYLMLDKPFISFLFLGIAFSFKLQAIFIFPLFLLVTISNPKYFKYVLIVPAIYLLTILPSYLAGRSFSELLFIYLDQAKPHDPLVLKAPAVYNLFPNAENDRVIWSRIGTIFTGVINLVLCLVVILRNKKRDLKISADQIIYLSLIFSLITPFFLPHMHERYFFLADALALIFAFYFRKFWFVPVILIINSTLTYLNYLNGFSVINLMHLTWLTLGVIVLLVVDFFKRSNVRERKNELIFKC